jgi:lipopolysaccharide/colanic/teichoic acid biosynthesis glycosyltransferase
MKRFFDLFISIIVIIVLFPLFILIALLIKLTSKGPIFFFQKRVGKSAKLFDIIKFRSMIEGNYIDTISIAGDSRITRLGSILRKYKLDELPELWNVVLGDMSLVGPRPDVPGYADKLAGENRKILKLRPGITGPASIKYSDEEYILSKQENPVRYNNEVLYPDKVKINLDYYYNNNIWIDIKIIFATIFKIIS